SSSQLLSMAGGGIGFGTDFSNGSSNDFDNCRNGADLPAVESCQTAFAFQPQSLGEQTESTAITLNDQRYPVTVVGAGVPALEVGDRESVVGGERVGDRSGRGGRNNNSSCCTEVLSRRGGAVGCRTDWIQR